MSVLLMILGGLLLLVGFFCSLIVLIDAFKNEVWKGVLYLLCGLYGLYYMLVEFQSEKKALILAGAFGGSIIGYGLMIVGGGMAAGGMAGP